LTWEKDRIASGGSGDGKARKTPGRGGEDRSIKKSGHLRGAALKRESNVNNQGLRKTAPDCLTKRPLLQTGGDQLPKVGAITTQVCRAKMTISPDLKKTKAGGEGLTVQANSKRDRVEKKINPRMDIWGKEGSKE